MPHTFDEAYYHRFYGDPRTRAASPAEQQRQARFIATYLRYLQVPVERILDVGCGLGRLLRQLEKAFPRAECMGVEVSSYLCDTYGWQCGDAQTYSDERPFDLVICSDVLGYLNKSDCARAVRNLSRLSRAALYLNVLTTEDLDICDPQHTDMNQKLRPVAWYRNHIDRHFVSVGGGLFMKKPLEYPVWHIERG